MNSVGLKDVTFGAQSSHIHQYGAPPMGPALSHNPQLNNIRRSVGGVGAAPSKVPIRYQKARRTAVTDGLEELFIPEWEKSPGMRHKVGEVIFSQRFEMFIGVVVLSNFATIAYEADGRCTMQSTPEDADIHIQTKKVMDAIGTINIMFLFIYCCECGSRFFVQRLDFFKNGWNLFDLSIVLCGIVGEVFERILTADSSAESMGVLRTMRMVRLLRVSRILISFQELYALISGLVNCMKTLMWAAMLVFVSLTIWSIIAVEYMHPLMDELEQRGEYTYCSWCPTAFKGIMNANLTFFQIISGDGWSTLARGLIERHPWTALVFIAVIFTMVFGLLNLVTAVIVDTAVRARELDTQSMSLQQEVQKNELWKKFQNMCKELDKDDSGCISCSELQDGFNEVPELRQFLSIMGVEEDDLVNIFELLDVDRSGTLTFDEFSGELQKLKTNHTQFTTYYIKRVAEDIRRHLLDTVNAAPHPSVAAARNRTSQMSKDPNRASMNSTASVAISLPAPPPVAVKPAPATLEPLSEESIAQVPSITEKMLYEAVSANDWKIVRGFEELKERIEALREKFDDMVQRLKLASPAVMVNQIMPNGHPLPSGHPLPLQEGGTVNIPLEGQLRENNNARLTGNRCGNFCSSNNKQ